MRYSNSNTGNSKCLLPLEGATACSELHPQPWRRGRPWGPRLRRCRSERFLPEPTTCGDFWCWVACSALNEPLRSSLSISLKWRWHLLCSEVTGKLCGYCPGSAAWWRSKPQRRCRVQSRLMPTAREQEDDLSRLTPVNGKESARTTRHNVFWNNVLYFGESHTASYVGSKSWSI